MQEGGKERQGVEYTTACIYVACLTCVQVLHGKCTKIVKIECHILLQNARFWTPET